MRLEYFRLVDRIVDLSLAERKISAEAAVPSESTIFEGHFPDHPIMPGVLLIEAMAQTSGWLIIAVMQFERMPFLAQVREARLRTFVAPGSMLLVHAELRHEGSGFAVANARITQDGKAVCDAELMLRMLPFPSATLRAKMRDTAAQIGLPMELISDG